MSPKPHISKQQLKEDSALEQTQLGWGGGGKWGHLGMRRALALLTSFAPCSFKELKSQTGRFPISWVSWYSYALLFTLPCYNLNTEVLFIFSTGKSKVSNYASFKVPGWQPNQEKP